MDGCRLIVRYSEYYASMNYRQERVVQSASQLVCVDTSKHMSAGLIMARHSPNLMRDSSIMKPTVIKSTGRNTVPVVEFGAIKGE